MRQRNWSGLSNWLRGIYRVCIFCTLSYALSNPPCLTHNFFFSCTSAHCWNTCYSGLYTALPSFDSRYCSLFSEERHSLYTPHSSISANQKNWWKRQQRRRSDRPWSREIQRGFVGTPRGRRSGRSHSTFPLNARHSPSDRRRTWRSLLDSTKTKMKSINMDWFARILQRQ